MDKIKPYQSLKDKFLVVFLMIVLISGATSCAIVYYYEGHAHRESLRNKGVSFARYVADLSKDPLLTQDSVALDSIVKSVNNDDEVAYAFVYDPQDNLRTGFFASVNLKNECVHQVLQGLPKSRSWPDIIKATRNNKDVMEVVEPVIVSSQKIGSVVIGLSKIRIDGVVRRSLYYLLWGNLAGCLFAFLLVLIVQRVFIDPIIALAALMRRIESSQDYTVRADFKANDELGELATGFNNMLDQIQVRDNELQLHRHYLENIVTERTAQLVKLSERQQIVLESAGEGIVGLDEAGCHTFVNKAACDLLGFSREELLGKPAHILWHHSRADGTSFGQQDLILDALHNGKSICIDDEVFWRADHVSFPVEYVISPIRDGQKVSGAVVIFRDITARQHAEEAIKKARVADEASRLKSKFISIVSHEMRTPLNGIIGFAELIKGSQDLGRSKNMASVIIHESEVLLGLVNDILDRAKIEAGKLTLNPEVVQIRELVSLLCKPLELRLVGKKVTLQVEIGDDVPGYFITDRLRIGQVVTNLLNNAMKFTEQGSVKLKIEKTSQQGERAVLCFSVIDTGVGIPEEKQHLIFERFAQIDGDLSRRFGGIGLGVSIAKSLVELMGGEIGFQSRLGQGTTFWFTLPVEIAQAPLIKAEDLSVQLSISAGQGRILVVEDYPSNQEIVCMHLEGAGYEAKVASDGYGALKICSEQKFDVILMDIQMPGIDGFETTRQLREMGGWLKDVPILGFTANVDNQTFEDCRVVGMNAVVIKPIRRETFLAEIRKWSCKKNSGTHT